MRHISPAKAAIGVGTVIGLYHLMSATIAFGTATLVVLTFALGALLGWIFALVWNWLGGERGIARRGTPAKAM